MNYPPGSSRSCHEADGRSDRSGGSGGTRSNSGSNNIYGSVDKNWCIYPSQLQPNVTSSSSPLTWQKWQTSFDALLNDGEGVALFKSYLDSEMCGNLLDFWFACQGFRSKVDPSDQKKILQLIKVIYQTYIRGSRNSSTSTSQSSSRHHHHHQPVRLRPETRRAIAERLLHKTSLDQTVFDEAQNEVGYFLRHTAYLAFLKSDAFISHIDGKNSKTHDGQSQHKHLFSPPFPPTSTGLPTVDEDHELLVSDKQPPPLIPRRRCVTPSTAICYPHQPPQQQSYHYFCNPYPPAPLPLPKSPACSCSQRSWPPNFFQPPQGVVAPPPASHSQPPLLSTPPINTSQPVPLTQENIQITRFQRAELPVPQHFSSCPHCHTPFSVPQVLSPPPLVHSRQSPLPGKPPHQQLLPQQKNYQYGGPVRSPTGASSATIKKWTDGVCPKYEFCGSGTMGVGCCGGVNAGEFPRAPPNPYHVSYAPVSAQDSERQSMSSGTAHTDENASSSFTSDYEDIKARMHLLHHRGRNLNHQAHHVYPPPPPGATTTLSAPGNHSTPQQQQQDLLASSSSALTCRHQRGRGSRRSAPPAALLLTNAAARAPAIKEQNLAELDPIAFSRLLSNKLQRLVDNQLAMERIDKLMTEGDDEEEEDAASPLPPKPEATPPSEPTENADTQLQEDTVRLIDDKTSGLQISISDCSAAEVDASGGEGEWQGTAINLGESMSTSSKPSVLNRLLAAAAARVQHDDGINAQSILEDHCSRIWATSADRTPTSSGSERSRPELKAHQLELGHSVTRGPTHLTEEEMEKEEEDGKTHLLDENPSSPSTFRPPPPKQCYDFELQVGESRLVTSRSVTERLQDLVSNGVTPNATFGRPPLRCSSPPGPPCFGGGGYAQPYSCLISPSQNIGDRKLVPSASPSPHNQPPEGGLVVGYYLCDDPVPYRSQWPTHEVTLGQFKQLVPKKGPFRFFFKKASNEFDSGVVHEEICNDNAILPLWEGKVVAKVERVE